MRGRRHDIDNFWATIFNPSTSRGSPQLPPNPSNFSTLPLFNSNYNDRGNIFNNTVNQTPIAQISTIPAVTAGVAEGRIIDNVIHKQVDGVDYLYISENKTRTMIQRLQRGDLSNCAIERVSVHLGRIGKQWALNLSGSYHIPHTSRGFEGVLIPDICREGFDDTTTKYNAKMEIIDGYRFIRGQRYKI